MTIERKINGEGGAEGEGKIKINAERCKGCGLCVAACPKKDIEISKKSNSVGYFPAQPKGEYCTGCGHCFLICPDICIEVYRKD